MTRSSELIRDLRSVLASIKVELKISDLTRRLDDKLVDLLASLGELRVVLVGSNVKRTQVRSAMSAASSRLKEAKHLYEQCYEQLKKEIAERERQKATSAFENFDQKANQLFNILNTVLKNEREAQEGITRNIV